MPDTANEVVKSNYALRQKPNAKLSIGDGRTVVARRFRELVAAHTGELGHEPSEGEASIIRRASALEVQLEQLEVAWTHAQPSVAELDAYSRLSNTLRRHLAAIGLGTNRPAHGSVLDRYLTSKGLSK